MKKEKVDWPYSWEKFTSKKKKVRCMSPPPSKLFHLFSSATELLLRKLKLAVVLFLNKQPSLFPIKGSNTRHRL